MGQRSALVVFLLGGSAQPTESSAMGPDLSLDADASPAAALTRRPLGAG